MFSEFLELEQFLTTLSELRGGVGSLEGRLSVALSFGYLDARFMVHMMETNGLPLSVSAIAAKKRGLKLDFSGLRVELERIGKKPDTIDSELREVKFFMEATEIE